MDLVFGLLFFILAAWLVVSYLIKLRPPNSVETTSDKESKSLEKVVDWQVSYQIKQNLQHKTAYKKAFLKNDASRTKVHKAMLVFGKSLLSHFSHEFSRYSKN